MILSAYYRSTAGVLYGLEHLPWLITSYRWTQDLQKPVTQLYTLLSHTHTLSLSLCLPLLPQSHGRPSMKGFLTPPPLLSKCHITFFPFADNVLFSRNSAQISPDQPLPGLIGGLPCNCFVDGWYMRQTFSFPSTPQPISS